MTPTDTPDGLRRLASFLRTRTFRDEHTNQTDRYAEAERSRRMARHLRRAASTKSAKVKQACIDMALAVEEMSGDELIALLKADDMVRAAEYERRAAEMEAAAGKESVA